MESPSNIHNLNDSDLVRLCLQHQRSAWEEFFRRFSPLIKKAIRRTFIICRVRELCDDIDNIMDIHAVIVGKLYAQGALNQCPDTIGLRAWLRRITTNEAYDWLKKRGRIKHLPKNMEERFLRSLSTPLGGEDDDFTLQDIIEDEDADLFDQLDQIAFQLYVECVIDQISSIKNPTHRWILRLHILGQLSLSDTELENLETISPYKGDELNKHVSALETSLGEKELGRQDDLGKTVLYWHQLRGLEAKISRLDRDTFSDHTLEIDALKLEWSELESKKKKLLSDCRSLPKPTNREIAEIVGIPEDKCGNVSKYIERAREALSKKMRNI